MESFIKKPVESYPIAFDFKEKLPNGSTLSSVSVSAIDTFDNTDQTAIVLLSTIAAVSDTLATFTVQGGTNGRSYKITGMALLNNGGPLIDEVLMVVSS